MTTSDPSDFPAFGDQRERTKISHYSLLFVVVDGQLQAEEQKVDVRVGPLKTRVYMRSAVPAAKLELDGRDRVGETFRVQVIGPGGESMVNADMQLRHFAVKHGVSEHAVARYVFECETPRPRGFDFERFLHEQAEKTGTRLSDLRAAATALREQNPGLADGDVASLLSRISA